MRHEFPLSAYVAFNMSLRSEWKFLQRLIPESSAWFWELNDVIQHEFILALLARRQFSEAEMELFELPVRWGGLGILGSTKAATSMVRNAILGDEPLDVPGHRAYHMLASSRSEGRRGRRSSRLGTRKS